MYIFVSLEKIISFFMKYGIDITLFSSFEQSLLIVLCNILMLLWLGFVFYVVYKLVFKIIGWWF